MIHLRCNDVKYADYIGKEVTVRGWVHRLRKQKENTFILIRDDRGGVIQCVLATEKAFTLTIESCIEVTGKLPDKIQEPQKVAMKSERLICKIYGVAKVDYPIGEYQSEDLLPR